MTNDRQAPLWGKRIAIPETRELDLLAKMLEAKGATAMRIPLVAILDAPDPGPVVQWIDDLVAGKFADVVFYTGEGIRRLAGFAERSGRTTSFIGALAKARKITRGPKPVRALRELGLDTDVRAAAPTTQGLIEALSGLELRGRPIGVQFYGQEANAELTAYLHNAGAIIYPVAPYVYATKSDEDAVAGLLCEIADGRVDLITFTSSTQIDRLVSVAQQTHPQLGINEILRRTTVAAVGPVVADALRSVGVDVRIVPEKSFFMRPMVNAIIDAVTSAGPQS